MKLTQPPKPKKGSKIYVISPSAGLLPFTEQRTKRAIGHLEQLGFSVVIAPNAGKNNGYVSAPVSDRVDDIHTAFADPGCSIVIASIGGNNANQLINELDYGLIRKNPKAFVGYSDNTVLHFAIASKAGLQTYYGPCLLNQFGEFPEVLPYTLEHFKDAVIEQKSKIEVWPSDSYTDEILDWFAGDDAKRARKLVPNKGFSWWKTGKGSGPAFAATIPSINHLLGTPYMIDLTGAILMIDIPEGHTMHEGLSVAEADAWLTDLANAGILAKLNGLVIGRPYKYNDAMVNELRSVVLRLTQSLDYPILCNVDIGHTDPMITVPLGAQAILDSKSQSSLSLIAKT